MDKDEEVDREGGGRKMSDDLVFSHCRLIPICKTVSDFSNCDRTFANQKSVGKGAAFTGRVAATLLSLPTLIYISASLLGIKLGRCLRFLYSRSHTISPSSLRWLTRSSNNSLTATFTVFQVNWLTL